MSKPKYASLTAGLLARKGEAAPTAQPFASLVPALPPAPCAVRSAPQQGAAGLAALIQRAYPPAALREVPRKIEPSPAPVATPAPAAEPPVRSLAREPAALIRTALAAALPQGEAHRRHGVTVRLDGPRYRRLTIVSARYGRTYQDILARALDVYMTALGIEHPGLLEPTAPRKPQ